MTVKLYMFGHSAFAQLNSAVAKLWSLIGKATALGHDKNNPSGFNQFVVPDTISYYHFQSNTPQTIFGQNVWMGGKSFGKKLNTIFYVPAEFLGFDFTSSNNIFWGTEKGMAQNNRDNSYWDYWPSAHYLNNINVNKITDIFGLSAFGGFVFGPGGMVKQNLLVVFTFNYPDKIQKCNNAPDTLQTEFNPGYHYRWYTNGVLNGDTTNVNIVTQSGRYKLEVSACTNSWVPSKEVELDMITLPLPTVSADKLIYCAEDTARLSVNIPAGNAYDINWYRDGALLRQFKNAVQISAFNLAFVSSPSFTFNYPSNLTYCAGTPVSLTVNSKPGYRYRWYRDQSLTGDTLSVINIAASGTYKVEVSACEGSWVPANPVNVNLIELPVPAISLDKPAYCIGDNAKMTINISPDPSYTISWYRDNIPVAADQDQQSVITSITGSYAVLLTSNTSNTDGSKCTKISGPQQLIFNPPPVISIREIVKTTICDGQTVGLQASYSGGKIKWSTGDSSDQINVTSPGNYMATVTSAAGCVADTIINVRFLPDPVLNLKDTSVCIYTAQTITLIAPVGFSAYQWNDGVSAAQTFQVRTPQTVSLTVTDANGCQATQQIMVSAQCPDVHIPNTFTPNGDGINDLWDIAGLEADHSALVKVYNRYGTLLYESKGYPTPWNGEMNGKKLPAGVYYYIVNAKNNKQKYSGSLTIIY
eukprot:gene17342-17533_t